MRFRSARHWILCAAVVLGATACGGSDGYGSGPSGTTNGTSTSVTVKNNVFDPANTTVSVGSTVTWTWAQGSVNHNVTFEDGPKSADQSSGGYVRVFDKAGTYPYRCTNHPAMTGTVTVK